MSGETNHTRASQQTHPRADLHLHNPTNRTSSRRCWWRQRGRTPHRGPQMSIPTPSASSSLHIFHKNPPTDVPQGERERGRENETDRRGGQIRTKKKQTPKTKEPDTDIIIRNPSNLLQFDEEEDKLRKQTKQGSGLRRKGGSAGGG